jgi:hypothetical protein
MCFPLWLALIDCNAELTCYDSTQSGLVGLIMRDSPSGWTITALHKLDIGRYGLGLGVRFTL